MLPVGNGYFLWILDRITGGDPVAMADRAVRYGLKWVAIKIANGYATFGSQSLNRAVTDAFHSRGIQVWGWHYVYGAYPEIEGNIAVAETNRFDLDGYIIDAEMEYKTPGRAVAAKQYLDILRRGIKKPIGLTSYRFPHLHWDFPWTTFLPRVDFNMPQVYWMGAHNAGEQLYKSVSQFRDLAPNQPLIPLGAAFTEQGWNPTVGEILEFRKVANDLKVPGYGWWEWYFAETRNPAWWDATTQDLATGEPPAEDPSVPTRELVYTSFTNLNIRSGPGTNFGVVGRMTPNKVFVLVERKGDWGRFADTDEWVHTGYVSPVKRIVTRYTNLRVRNGPSLSAAVLGYMQPNVPQNVVDVSGSWGRLEGPTDRWVHLQYVTEL